MGDQWPWLSPRTITWARSRAAAKKAGFSDSDSAVAAAISEAESQLDWTVLNNTPATGDYSVGLWQINYYGSLYAGRVAAFGTPEHLVRGGPDAQARAAFTLWQSSGFTPWSTFNNGAYIAYLQGNRVPTGPGGSPELPASVYINPPTEDYSPTIRGAADKVNRVATQFHLHGLALRHLIWRYPDG